MQSYVFIVARPVFVSDASIPHSHLKAQQLKDSSTEHNHFELMGREDPLFSSALCLIRLCWLQSKTPGFSKAGRELTYSLSCPMFLTHSIIPLPPKN